MPRWFQGLAPVAGGLVASCAGAPALAPLNPPVPCNNDQVELLALRMGAADRMVRQLHLPHGVQSTRSAVILPRGRAVDAAFCFVRGTDEADWRLLGVADPAALSFAGARPAALPDGRTLLDWRVRKTDPERRYEVVWEVYLQPPVRTADATGPELR